MLNKQTNNMKNTKEVSNANEVSTTKQVEQPKTIAGLCDTLLMSKVSFAEMLSNEAVIASNLNSKTKITKSYLCAHLKFRAYKQNKVAFRALKVTETGIE